MAVDEEIFSRSCDSRGSNGDRVGFHLLHSAWFENVHRKISNWLCTLEGQNALKCVVMQPNAECCWSCADLLGICSNHYDAWIIFGVFSTFFVAEFDLELQHKLIYDEHTFMRYLATMRRLTVVCTTLKKCSLVRFGEWVSRFSEPVAEDNSIASMTSSVGRDENVKTVQNGNVINFRWGL